MSSGWGSGLSVLFVGDSLVLTSRRCERDKRQCVEKNGDLSAARTTRSASGPALEAGGARRGSNAQTYVTHAPRTAVPNPIVSSLTPAMQLLGMTKP